MLKEKIQKIEFIDLQAQQHLLGKKIPDAIAKVLKHGLYILGPEVSMLEEQLKEYTGAEDVITCSNGTDALRLLLLHYDLGPNDAVFVPTFTFASTAEVIAEAKATPVFVDLDPDTYNIDPKSLIEAISSIQNTNLQPKGIIGVDLFGLPANYPEIEAIAKAHNMWVIADAAQSFGGSIDNKQVGTLATTTAASFFPSKPLACYGDGGAVFTTDKEIGARIRSLRNHGCGSHRYDHINIGLNSRLDTLQASILIEKLKIFPNEMKRRQEIAKQYNDSLQSISCPIPPNKYTHAWGLYTVACDPSIRDSLMESLSEKGIPCNVYYRKPLHLQPAYQAFPKARKNLEQAERACQSVISLPMHPYLTDEQVEYICYWMNEYITSS